MAGVGEVRHGETCGGEGEGNSASASASASASEGEGVRMRGVSIVFENFVHSLCLSVYL